VRVSGPAARSVAFARFLRSDRERLRAARVIVSVGFIVGTLLSIPLWISERAFPLFPSVPLTPLLPPPLDWIALTLLWALGVGIIVRARPRAEIVALAAIVALLVFEDQTRCQPWLYQYILTLLAALPPREGAESGEAERSQLAALRIMTASLYCWSGLQKVNLLFFIDNAPWFMEPITRHVPTWLGPILDASCYALPAVEIFVGIGTLLQRVRRAALLVGLLMHLFILYAIGPLGHDVNTVVWPWNVTMMGLLWVLFGQADQVPIRPLWSYRPALLGRFAIVGAFAILPAMNFLGLWNLNLSWGLYSEMFLEVDVNIDETAMPCLPPEVRQHVKATKDGNVLSIFEWAVDVLNVPPWPAPWVFHRLRDQLCRCDPHGELISFDIWEPVRWQLPIPFKKRRCGETW